MEEFEEMDLAKEDIEMAFGYFRQGLSCLKRAQVDDLLITSAEHLVEMIEKYLMEYGSK